MRKIITQAWRVLLQDKSALMGGNVFAMQHKWRKITFDSRAVESYARHVLHDADAEH